MAKLQDLPELEVAPTPKDDRLTASVDAVNQNQDKVNLRVVTEKPLTIYLNAREIVTAMTIGDHPDLLAIGFLRNQRMIPDTVAITSVDFDEDLGVVVVRTDRQTDFEDKLSKKTRTSGCAVGTVFGDMMDGLEGLRMPQCQVRTSWLYTLSNKINRIPSLYLEAGAIHGTVLCEEDRPLVYMEDVGRHNAVDKVAGWMFRNETEPTNKILYTTGRLTSEMVLKTAQMGIPVLASRSGFTEWGVDLARQFDMTLIGRLRGKRFMCVSGEGRILFDADPSEVSEEEIKHRRKGAGSDE